MRSAKATATSIVKLLVLLAMETVTTPITSAAATGMAVTAVDPRKLTLIVPHVRVPIHPKQNTLVESEVKNLRMHVFNSAEWDFRVSFFL